MKLPQWLAKANRKVTNPLFGLISPWAPLFGTIHHVGRKSGKTFKTPVTVFTAPEGFLVILTYGPDRDWLKNLAAAGGGEVEHRGKIHKFTEPRVLPRSEANLTGIAKIVASRANFEFVAVLPVVS